MDKNTLFRCIVEFLLLLFFFLLGRTYGVYEIISSRPPFHIVSEVNPGISLVRIKEGDCDGVSGIVEGRTVRLMYRDDVVALGKNAAWHIQWKR